MDTYQLLVTNVLYEMDDVFDAAKEKAKSKLKKPGYTDEPWKDFGSDFLIKRLEQEFYEFEDAETIESQNEELLDIINMSIFVYLANKKFIHKKVKTWEKMC